VDADAVIERVMKPHTGKADAHRHLDIALGAALGRRRGLKAGY
jgi:hypothetical protein